MSDETQGLPDQTTEAETSVVDAPAIDEPKVHPAHEKLLAELPEAWHSKVTPYLQEQDKYYQKEMEKYTPYKEFVEAGISPDLVRGGLNLASAIESDPTEVYSSLQTYLRGQGLLPDEAASVAQDMMEQESGEDFEDLFSDDNIPNSVKAELDALKAKQAEADEYIYQQEFAKAEAEELATLENEMADLRSAHNITEAHETAIYDLMSAALNAGRIISVAEAAQQLQGMIGSFAPAGAAESAPTVVGSAGGAGIVAPDLAIPKDDKGKKEMLARMFDQYNKANQ
jgi:hypothetical protein